MANVRFARFGEEATTLQIDKEVVTVGDVLEAAEVEADLEGKEKDAVQVNGDNATEETVVPEGAIVTLIPHTKLG